MEQKLHSNHRWTPCVVHLSCSIRGTISLKSKAVQRIKYQTDFLKCRYKTIFTLVLHSRKKECWWANATVVFLSTRTVCKDTVDPEIKLFHTMMIKESKIINVFLRIGQDLERNCLKHGSSLSTLTCTQVKSKSAHAQTPNTCINAHESSSVSLLCNTAAR